MIKKVYTVISVCDVCGHETGPFTTTNEGEIAPKFIVEQRWNASWSGLVTRHYCSDECADFEGHGLLPIAEGGGLARRHLPRGATS